MRRFPSKWFSGALLLCFMLCFGAAGCSSGEGATSTGTDDTINSATTDQATTSAPTTVSTTTEAAPTTDPGLEPEAAALETWTRVLDAAKTGDPDDGQIAVIDSLANRNTAEQLKDFFPEAPARELTHYPQLTTQDDGTIAIDDCIIMNRGISTGISNWFVGTAAPNPDSPTGWTINNLQLINLEPCIPRSIADAAIQGYENYVDAKEVFLNPPDPESPQLIETTTGGHREFMLGLIDDLASNDQVLYGPPETDPGFPAILSPTEIVITDCQLVNEEYGVYNATTGERTDRIEPISPGELDLREITMTLEGGQWKVSNAVGSRNVQCRTPPVVPTLQITGG